MTESRPSRTLRRIAVVLITALLGVITTVAVSWGCAWWVNPLDVVYKQFPLDGMSDPNEVTDPDFDLWHVVVYEMPGGTIVRSSWLDEDNDTSSVAAEMAESNDWPERSPDDILPRWWGDAMRPVETGTNDRRHERIGDAWGWPFLAMRSHWWSVDTMLFVPTYQCDHCIRLKGKKFDSDMLWDHDRAFPLAIIWQGFTLNTLLYWSAWLILYCMFVFIVGGTRTLWRRHKKRCTRCGYDLRGKLSGRCPECGANS